MNEAPEDRLPPAAPPQTGWSRKQLAWLIILILAAQLGYLALFDRKPPASPTFAASVPHFQLATPGDELIALSDPTLFVLPHANDFGAALWQQPSAVVTQSFSWTEPPQFLGLAPDKLGAAFQHYMHTNQAAAYPYAFKPEPPFAAPALTDQPAADTSTLQIFGDLAPRNLLNPPALPDLPGTDVLPPSTVQLLVDPDGLVSSLVLLPPESPLEAQQANTGDTNALRLARNLRFTPSTAPTFGEIVFHWHTVPRPPAGTNNTP